MLTKYEILSERNDPLGIVTTETVVTTPFAVVTTPFAVVTAPFAVVTAAFAVVAPEPPPVAKL